MKINQLFIIFAYLFTVSILFFTGIMVTKVVPYLTFERAINFLGTKPDSVLDRNYFMVSFYVHITSSVLAMGGGIFQFFPFLLRGYHGWLLFFRVEQFEIFERHHCQRP